MKKSVCAVFFVLFGLMGAPAVFADDLPEVAPASDDAPLPPMVDPAIAGDSSAE